MKVTFISNAAAIYESQGFRLLADPWLSESCFDKSWYHDPPLLKTTPTSYLDVDALYISHIHQDHCDVETLKHFRRDIPIVTLSDKYDFCAKHLHKMGFTNIHGLRDRDAEQWKTPWTEMKLTMFAPFATHPFHASECELGNVVDSALLIEADGQSVLNCNDNTLTVEKAHWFRETYGAPTLAQLNYNCAGPYPACFNNLTLAEKRSESLRLIGVNLNHMKDTAIALGAKAVQPFAGAFRLGGSPDKEAMNAYNGTCRADEAGSFLAIHGVTSITLGEGDEVDLGTL